MIKKYYLAVTPDEYELPLCVAETAQELADKMGIKRESILSNISRNRTGSHCGCKYLRIEFEEGE